MSKCVLCLGNWRKQTFQAEILISELQSKLWKWHLRALSPGPHHPWRVRNTSRKHALLTHTHTDTHVHTPPEWTPQPTCRQEQYFSPSDGHLAYRSSSIICPHEHNGTNLFLCAVPGSMLCLLSEGTFPLQAGFATCLWNIFFSYLRDKWDLHFPLNTNWLCLFFFFFRISDIWSNANLFSYVTFSNNWAVALAEPVSIISERGKVHIFTLLHVNRRGWYSY